MSAVLFVLGFLGAGIAWSDALAVHDPEPIGALASMVFFTLLATPVSVVAYLAMSHKFKRSPGVFASLASGALSVSVFCATIGSVFLGFPFWLAVSTAFCASALLAGTLALLTPAALRRANA